LRNAKAFLSRDGSFSFVSVFLTTVICRGGAEKQGVFGFAFFAEFFGRFPWAAFLQAGFLAAFACFIGGPSSAFLQQHSILRAFFSRGPALEACDAFVVFSFRRVFSWPHMNSLRTRLDGMTD